MEVFMANYLKMTKVSAIQTLKERNWSCRRISRELGIHLDTVRKYVNLSAEDSKQVSAPTGSEDLNASCEPAGKSEPDADDHEAGEDGKITGSTSQCEPYRKIIEDKLKEGLNRKRIHQDLRDYHDFEGSYYSVRRFVQKLGKNSPVPFRRMECMPGEEAQIDFGRGAPVIDDRCKRRRTHVIRVVLSFSRKAYSEVVYSQTTDNFIRCLENAFWHFGGAAKTLVIDNLKAAVKKADWYDPEIHPKIQSFCSHYGAVIMPCKPYFPHHKGKVEKGVGYVKNNALKGRRFSSLSQQNQFLLHWETHIADTRIHGTTRKQVGKLFREQEKPHLLKLPVARFPCFTEAKRSVHRDGHIEVQKAYYSVPPEYTARQVWARWDGHLVRIFNSRMEQIAVHTQVEAGKFQTQSRHIHCQKRTKVEKGTVRLLERVCLIGANADRWAQAMLEQRGIPGVRVLVGLLNLANRYECSRIDNACETALSHGAFRLKTIRDILNRSADKQQQMDFIDEHPIIRDMSSYGEFVRDVLR
jgi:transposase